VDHRGRSGRGAQGAAAARQHAPLVGLASRQERDQCRRGGAQSRWGRSPPGRRLSYGRRSAALRRGSAGRVGAGSAAGAPVSAREVFRLAVPALGVLAAEPLYVLVDTAVVGHLGALPLAGLAVGGVVLAQVSAQLTFLSYGTTARTARLHGAGRRKDAVSEGVQATWLALAVGVVVLVLGQLLAEPIAGALAGADDIAANAVSWLRIALFGAPLILVTMAGNGWMRGVQDARRPLYYVLAGNGISAVLCPLLVYGVGWGLEGS